MKQEKTTRQAQALQETLKLTQQEMMIKWMLHTINETDDIYAVRDLSEVMYDHHLQMIDLIEAQVLEA